MNIMAIRVKLECTDENYLQLQFEYGFRISGYWSEFIAYIGSACFDIELVRQK